MATMTPRELVDAVAAQITSELGGSGWSRSRYPVGLFPGDGRVTQHKAFAVGLDLTAPNPADRQRSDVLVQTTVVVRFSWSLKSADLVGDYADALDGERVLVAAVKGTTVANKLHSILFAGVTVRDAQPNVYLGEVRFEAQHKYDLTAA